MKKLGLALLLAILGLAPAQAQPVSAGGITCNKFFAVSQGATALTKIISGIAGQNISLCGFVYNSGAAASTVGLSYGTGTNCGTDTTVLIPVISLPINGLLVNRGDFASIPVPAANASAVPIDLCLVTTGTGPAVVIIHYAQF